MREGDVDYHNARTFSLVYPTTDEIDAFIHEVADLALLENALNPYAFPSLKVMQRDVVRIARYRRFMAATSRNTFSFIERG